MGTLIKKDEIRARKLLEEIDRCEKTKFEKSIELGNLLIKMKGELQHGEFGEVCERLFGDRSSKRTLQQLMRVARSCDENRELANLGSIDAVLRSLPKGKKAAKSADSALISSGSQQAIGVDEEATETTSETAAPRAAHVGLAETVSDSNPSESRVDPDTPERTASAQLLGAKLNPENPVSLARAACDAIRILKAMDDPAIAPMLNEIIETAGVQPPTAEAEPQAIHRRAYSVEEAMAAVDGVAESLKAGQKVKFKNLMSRRWNSKDELKSSSKPGDYLPSLPKDIRALAFLFREFRHRLAELKLIDIACFGRGVSRTEFEEFVQGCWNTLQDVQVHFIPSAGRKGLFDDDSSPDEVNMGRIG